MIWTKLGEIMVSLLWENIERWHITLTQDIFLYYFSDVKSNEVHAFINLTYHINICLSQPNFQKIQNGSQFYIIFPKTMLYGT